ncbi:MAG: hypothetical protein ACQERB_02755 [Promethearchaeati archaeon]
MKDYKIIFLIKSDTVNLNNYTIKDIPGSSGRLDVIARCILSALLNEKGFDINYKIWIFFKRYGALKFDPLDLNYEDFPKNELLLSEYIVKLLKTTDTAAVIKEYNPLSPILVENISLIEFLKQRKKENRNNIFVLRESGRKFLDVFSPQSLKKEVYIIIGSQTEDFINSEAFLNLNFPEVSLGVKSYLASQVIRLIKLNINHFL